MTEHLLGLGVTFNLVFHDIVLGRPKTRFSVTAGTLDSICATVVERRLAGSTRLYFDDGLRSVATYAAPIIAQYPDLEVVVAVPVATIGAPGFLGWNDLDAMAALGYAVVPHGYDHVRLASYDGPSPRASPAGGPYTAAGGRSDDSPLRENEVLFQLVESSEGFRQFEPREFVLPYGAYNADVIGINARHGIFSTLSTADFAWDTGQELRPRLLIERSMSAADVLVRLARGE